MGSDERPLKDVSQRLSELDKEINDVLSQPEITSSKAKQLAVELKNITAQLTSREGRIEKLLGEQAKSPSEQALIAEYTTLSSFINARRTQQASVNGFLVTGAGLVLTFAIGSTSSTRIRGLVSLIAVLLVVVAWINWRGLRVLDRKTYHRIFRIEGGLNVEGVKSIYDNIHEKKISLKRLSYWARDYVWDFFYGIVFAASMVTFFYLFFQVS